MARAKTVPRWPFGLAAAVAGLLLVLFAYTGDRVFSLGWFYVAVAGLVVSALGIGFIGYDRAIRPEVERRRARGQAPPPFKARARTLLEDHPPLTLKKAEGEAPKGKLERVRMSCPSCAHVLTAEGVRPIAVACPRCGTEGVLP